MKERNNGLQCLRSFACILIFLSHYNAFHHFTTKFDAGAFGVEIFIILSGFLKALYTPSCDKIEKKSIKKLLLTLTRKFKNIYPLHLATLLAAIPFELDLIERGESSLKHFISAGFLNLLCIQSFIPRGSFYFSFNSVSWYLSLVLLFLLLGDYLVYIINIVSKKIKITVILICLFLIEIMWAYYFQFFSLRHWLIYINPLVRCFDFCIGITIAYIYKQSEYNKKNIKNFVLLSLISTIFGWYICRLVINTKFEAWSLSVCFIPASICLIISFALIGNVRGGGVNSKNIIVLFGNVTMEFFLLHQIICRYLCKVLTTYGLFETVTNNLIYGLCITVIGFLCTILVIIIWRKFCSIILEAKQCKKNMEAICL